MASFIWHGICDNSLVACTYRSFIFIAVETSISMMWVNYNSFYYCWQFGCCVWLLQIVLLLINILVRNFGCTYVLISNEYTYYMQFLDHRVSTCSALLSTTKLLSKMVMCQCALLPVVHESFSCFTSSLTFDITYIFHFSHSDGGYNMYIPDELINLNMSYMFTDHLDTPQGSRFLIFPRRVCLCNIK